jgi:hypothetical protein
LTVPRLRPQNVAMDYSLPDYELRVRVSSLKINDKFRSATGTAFTLINWRNKLAVIRDREGNEDTISIDATVLKGW